MRQFRYWTHLPLPNIHSAVKIWSQTSRQYYAFCCEFRISCAGFPFARSRVFFLPFFFLCLFLRLICCRRCADIISVYQKKKRKENETKWSIRVKSRFRFQFHFDFDFAATMSVRLLSLARTKMGAKRHERTYQRNALFWDCNLYIFTKVEINVYKWLELHKFIIFHFGFDFISYTFFVACICSGPFMYTLSHSTTKY